MNLDLYYIFYTVAKEGSISASQKLLFISQPAITFHIKKLEEQLGISLFTRTKHGMQLTEEGKILYESNLKKLETGNIRIGISTTICRYVLMPYLEKFHKMYPSIDIQINNNVSDNLVKELRNGNLDILVLFESSTDNKDLVTIPIKKTQDIFASNKEYYELCKNNIEELKNLPLIFPKLNSNSRIHLDNYLTTPFEYNEKKYQNDDHLDYLSGLNNL